MLLNAITGNMARRMLVNFRIHPRAAQAILPAAVRPSLVHGWAIAGLCLVKLTGMRPRSAPAWTPGFTSENVAIRMAVEWGDPANPQHAVLIFRRDSSSNINTLFGGRFFPGPVHPARIIAHDLAGDIRIAVQGKDGRNAIDVAAHEAGILPETSFFRTLEEAADFFRGGEAGYSPANTPGMWDGLHLQLDRWSLLPLAIDRVRSTFISAINAAIPGAAVFDSAFIMRDIPHTWTALPQANFGILPTWLSAPARRQSTILPARLPRRTSRPDFILH